METAGPGSNTMNELSYSEMLLASAVRSFWLSPAGRWAVEIQKSQLWRATSPTNPRISCSAATESGTCPDAKTFYLNTVESAVLNGLKAELRAPKVIAEYVCTYLEEWKRLAAESHAEDV